MVIDHINAIWFDHQFFPMFLIGRGTLPLFCYAVAIAALKGKPGFPARYATRLLILAVLTQPFYYFSLGGGSLNVIFTLAAGGILASFSDRLKWWELYGLYIAAMVSCLWKVPLDGGLSAVMLPSAIVLALRGQKSVYPFLFLLLVCLNANGILEATRETSINSAVLVSYAFIALATMALSWFVLDFARGLSQTKRLLPKYALHVFYPGHLVILKLAGTVIFK